MPDALNNREGTQARKPSYVPEWAELWRKTGQRGLLIASYKRLEKRLQKGHNSCGGGSPCHCTLGAARVPSSQATVLPSHSTLLGQSFHRQKNSCTYTCWVASVVSYSLRPCGLWLARLLCQGVGFTRQEYWSVLAHTGCHTLLEHSISCCPSC